MTVATAGCSINEYGLVEHERYLGEGHVTLAVSAFGIHLDTRDVNPSLTMGRYQAVHVFPDRCADLTDVAALETGALFRRVHQQISISHVYGLQIMAGPGESSLTLGMREHARLLSVDQSTTMRRSIIMNPSEPVGTKLDFDGRCLK